MKTSIKREIGGFLRLLSFLGFLCLAGCGAATPETVTLPIPFGGSLTGDTNVVVAEGRPVGGAVGSLSVKNQAQPSGATQTWTLFDGTSGVSRGSLTFFPDSVTVSECTPFSAEGNKRIYTMRVSANLDGQDVSSSNFKCFEFPTDYQPSFDGSEVGPGATAVVRKAYCSGNNDLNGELINGKLLMGMGKTSECDFTAFTQEESAVLIDGLPFQTIPGDPEGKVVMTVMTQGFANFVPGATTTDLAFPLQFPGSTEVVGTQIHTYTQPSLTVSNDQLEFFADIRFFISSSSIMFRGTRIVLHAIDELNPIVGDVIQTFPDFPCTDQEVQDGACTILQGRVFYPIIEGSASPVDCTDPNAPISPGVNEASGFFKDLCEKHGTLDLRFRCSIMFNPETFEVVTIEGTWLLLRP